MTDEDFDTALFRRHELRDLIDAALAMNDPLVMNYGKWVRWSKRLQMSSAYVDRFHKMAAACLARFDSKPRDHVVLPTSVEEARAMFTVADRYLKDQEKK